MTKRYLLILFIICFIMLLGVTQVVAQDEQTSLDARCSQCHSELMTMYAKGPHTEMSCVRCHNQAAQHVAAPNEVPPGVDVSADNCGKCHNLQYESYRAVKKVEKTPQKQDEFPLLKKLLSGHAFAKDYREPREHFNMLNDIQETTRGKGATCWNCKSADVYYQWGDTITYDSDVEVLLKSGVIRHAITCVNCHNPHTGESRIVQEALKKAIADAPENHPAKKDKMGNYVCNQCHVEYNFNPGAKNIDFPFRKVEDMPEYIKQNNFWRDHATGGWEQPELGFMLFKVQHPESELYWDSKHFNAGVTCTDCHMPKIKAEDGTTYTQHWVTSTKNHPKESCENCHPGQNHNQRVEAIQEPLYNLMKTTMDNMSEAIDKIEFVRKADLKNDQFFEEAKGKYFTAHLNWEWIGAENSMGFHNPEETKRILNVANDNAKEAVTAATKATTEINAAEESKEPVKSMFSGPTGIALIALILAIAAGFMYFLTRRRN